MAFLEFERGQIKLDKPIRRGVRAAEEMLERYVQFERSTLNNNIKDLKEQMKGLYVQLEEVRSKGKESVARIDMKLQQQGIELRKWYEKQLVDISRKAMEVLDLHYIQVKDVDKVKRQVENTNRTVRDSVRTRITKKSRANDQ